MKTLLSKSRYLVLIAVLSSLMISLTTFLWGTYKTILACVHFAMAVGGEAHRIRVEAIGIMDIFLIATALLIFALGLFELFVGKLDLPKWLTINNLEDLNVKLRGVVIFVMVVTFLEKLVLWEDPQGTLLFGIAIAIISAVLVFAGMYGKEDSPG